MSFASISCCRGPTKADIESAWRPGATAERIGSRGIRPRQELATASMVPGRVALGEALSSGRGSGASRLHRCSAAWQAESFTHSGYNPCVYTPVPPQRILLQTSAPASLSVPQYPAAPLPAAQPVPALASLPHTTAHDAPCVLSIPPPVFTGTHKRPTRPFGCDACTYMLGALSRAVPERVVRRITLAAMMYKMSAGQFDLVYNSLSFTLASMMAPEPEPEP